MEPKLWGGKAGKTLKEGRVLTLMLRITGLQGLGLLSRGGEGSYVIET